MTFILRGRPASHNKANVVPYNPDDPVSQYLLASKKSDAQKADELLAASKRGASAYNGRQMGKSGDKR